jgi:hypothetical protein
VCERVEKKVVLETWRLDDYATTFSGDRIFKDAGESEGVERLQDKIDRVE